MINRTSAIQIEPGGKQKQNHKLRFFNFVANESDVHLYAGGCIPAHWHEELEFFWLREGKVKIEIENKVHELRAGGGCFINSGILHSFTAYKGIPCAYQSFVFDAGIIGGMPGSVFDLSYVKPLLEKGTSYLEFHPDRKENWYFEKFEEIFKISEEEPAGYEIFIRNRLSEMLLGILQVSRNMPSRQPETVQEKRVKELLNWVDEHLLETVTLKNLAAAGNISPRECQRIFGKYLHKSPMEYLQWKRILEAARKLSETEEEITDIALGCGFCSPSYFTKKFKEFMDHTPREYRALTRREK